MTVRTKRPTNGRVRLLDVAAAAGVSKSVASRALAGAPDIAAGTKVRVRQVAEELGYHPSVRARSLMQGQGAPLHAALVGLDMTPEVLGAFVFGPVLAGILSGAADEGLDLQHVAVGVNGGGPGEALGRLVAEDRADGLILLTTLPLSRADVAPLDRAGVPYVLVNRHFDDHPVNCVTCSWEEAAHDALRRLAGLGHRSAALLLPAEDNTSVAGRAAGWSEAVRRLGLDARDVPVLRYPGSPSLPSDALVQGQALASRLLSEGLPGTGQPPTALVGFNDWCALGVLRAAAALGVPVPEQLSVVGFDNTLIGVGTSPPLCSYAPRFVELGRRAAALLAAALRGELPEPRRLMVPVDFISRESCGPAPAQSRAIKPARTQRPVTARRTRA